MLRAASGRRLLRPGGGMIILFNKPYGVLCQFSRDAGRPCLADHVHVPDVYPAGRLDLDSEGLLLLTDDGAIAHRITDPRHNWPKTYWAQVEGAPSGAAIEQLSRGVTLRDGRTRPALAALLPGGPPDLWLRDPPIRYRAAIPTHWIALTLTEGRNRQVRRMTAAVGLPTLRLIRARIGPYALEGLRPGESRLVSAPKGAY